MWGGQGGQGGFNQPGFNQGFSQGQGFNQGFNQGQGQGFNQGFNQGQGFNQIQPSAYYGGNGGAPGEHKGPNYSLIGVRGRAGGAVDRLQFLFVDVITGQCVETPGIGGNGGNAF